MSCFFEEENGTTLAVLRFEREQLLYDIRNCAYIEGHIMETDNVERRHTVQDVGEDSNVDRVTRVLDLTVAKCRELLYPYAKHDIRRPILNDKLKDACVYGIVLKLPFGFSQTTLSLLERLIHEYLVCRSLADWMSITNPEKERTWAEKAAAAETEIRASLNARMGITRRRLHPF